MRLRSGALFLMALGVVSAQAPKVDPAIPPYKKEVEFPGLSSVGSDSLATVMGYWADGFSKFHPTVKVAIDAKGSATAPPALIEGKAQLGPMSREMNALEVERFEKKFGYKPTPIVVALDALVVLVNQDNPLKSLTLPQLDAIYSHTRKGGHPEDIASWGQLGLEGEFAKAPITLYGRNSLSGTNAFFKEHALFKGSYKPTVKEEEEAMAAVWAVAGDKFAMCYVGLGNGSETGVRPLSLATKAGAAPEPPTFAGVLSGKYPLGRRLFVYINREPKRPITPVVREFLRFILSAEGQQVVANNGFLPLTADLIRQELSKLE
jgi:phosphate transport system substrate-binding protein